MAAATLMSSTPIAGLHCEPTRQDLELSRKVHNSLRHPDELPEITDDPLKSAGELFVRYGVQHIFGIHLLHNHFTAPEGTVLLGTQFPITDTTQACWTRPVPVETLAAKPLHGHVFRLQPDGSFVAYEFHEGELGLASGVIDPSFYGAFIDFLKQKHLSNFLALELLDGPKEYAQKELQVGSQATVLLHEHDVLGLHAPSVTTGWSFHVNDDGVISCKGGTTYAGKVDGTHRVFVDSKPLPTVEALKDALRAEGTIN